MAADVSARPPDAPLPERRLPALLAVLLTLSGLGVLLSSTALAVAHVNDAHHPRRRVQPPDRPGAAGRGADRLPVGVAGPVARPGRRRPGAGGAVGLWTLWAGNLGPGARDLLGAARGGRSFRPYKPLAGVIGDDEAVLAEDGFVSVARGRKPVVLDPYMLVYLEQRDPEAVAELAGRIRRREFAWIVLRARPDVEPRPENDRYRQHFGPTVIDAVREAYRFDREAEGLYLYVPRRE